MCVEWRVLDVVYKRSAIALGLRGIGEAQSALAELVKACAGSMGLLHWNGLSAVHDSGLETEPLAQAGDFYQNLYRSRGSGRSPA